MFVVTAAQMRELDRATIEDIGIPGAVLMEAAGRGTVEHIRELCGPGPDTPVAVLCGGGNNGGDGFVIARHLLSDGCNVSVFLLADPEKLSDDSKLYLDAWQRLGGRLVICDSVEALKQRSLEISTSSLRIDAMLGTGLSGEVRGHYARAIQLLNGIDHGVTVAVDIPSGLDADSGHPLGLAVRADLTVTFGYPKLGHVLMPGPEYSGNLQIVDIGIPRAVVAKQQLDVYVLDEVVVKQLLPVRRRDAHKGYFGHLLLLAGSPGKSGAALLASQAALRGGCGLVTLASDAHTRAALAAAVPEAMSATLGDVAELEALASGMQALACGPGLGTSDQATEWVRWVVRDCPVPAVLDADAINIIANGNLGWLADAVAPRVLTPHPGEMGRLLGCSAADVQRARLKAAREFAVRHGVTLALKGARTLVASHDSAVAIIPTGGPALATAGTGDVLTGVIGAFLAQGLDADIAAHLGAYVHGAAGDLAGKLHGEAAVVASDVSMQLGAALSP